jgi:hypothetical protein
MENDHVVPAKLAKNKGLEIMYHICCSIFWPGTFGVLGIRWQKGNFCTKRAVLRIAIMLLVLL